MPKFEALGPDAETLGGVMLSMFNCINRDNIYPVLVEHGLTDIQADQWYPHQVFLDVLRDVAGSAGNAMFDFVSIGLKVVESVVLPPEVEAMSFEQVMLAMNDFYQVNQRGRDKGSWEVKKAGEKHIIAICRTPFPDDLEYGSMYGFARRFLPKGTHFSVSLDPSNVRRDLGGAETIFHIKWE